MTANRRRTLSVAFACALSSTVLYPLFIGSAWFYAGLGAIITVAACGALSRLRALPVAVCLAIGVAGLLLYLNLVFEVRHSWLLVIPTPGSLSRLWELAGTGFTDSPRYAPPAPELSGLVLLSTGGIAITAVLTDLIAVRLRSAALAGLPLLVLFTVPVTMNAQHQGIGTLVVFCLGTAGYLTMLSADGRERIRVWGRLVSLWRSGAYETGTARGPGRAGAYPGMAADGETGRTTGPEPGPDTRALAASGRRVGLASVILALCVPLILPGLHSSKLLSSGPGIGGAGGAGTAAGAVLPDTLSLTLSRLKEGTPTKVLSYTTTAPRLIQADDPQYLRAYVYDTLGATGWTNSGYTAGEQRASTIPPAQGLGDTTHFPSFDIAVEVNNHALTSPRQQTFLPVPYPATAVLTQSGVWLTDPELMVYSQGTGADVRAYRAAGMAVDPTAAELESAPRPSPSSSPGSPADLRLPDSYESPALRQIAKEHTRGATTELGKVDALAAWLSSPAFAYKADAPSFHSAEGLLRFLTVGKAGVCVQSAYAMAVLTRLLGYPARLAGGYTEGTPTSPTSSTYVVKTDDAHAWAEVYFPGYGWLRFEATPAGGDGSARASIYQLAAPGPGAGLPPGVIDTIGGAKQPSAPAAGHGILKPIPADGGAGGVPLGKPAGAPWAAIVVAVLAAIALMGGIIAIVAPPARRSLSAHTPEAARRRRPVSLGSMVLVAAAVAIVALALYRLLGRASGLDLRAGWATVGIAFGAACAFVLVVPGVIRIGIRRWRWLRAGDDASRAHTAWHELRDDLADLGVGFAPSEPPRTLADRVTTGLAEPARVAVRRLALAEERASYAARPSGSAGLRRDAATARRAIAASVRRGSRWRARIFPTSVMTAVADSAVQISDRLAALVSRRWSERGSAS